MLKANQIRALERAIAEAGRTDLAELTQRIRVARKAEFEEHIRRLIRQIKTDRRLRRDRIREIRVEVRDFKSEWQRQARRARVVRERQA